MKRPQKNSIGLGHIDLFGKRQSYRHKVRLAACIGFQATHRSRGRVFSLLDIEHGNRNEMNTTWHSADPKRTGVEIESESPLVAPDCPVAAFVASEQGNYLLAVAVFYPEIGESQLREVRHFCQTRSVRFFPLERLHAYHHQLLDRVAMCEEAGLKEECVSRILPEARCPNCGGPPDSSH